MSTERRPEDRPDGEIDLSVVITAHREGALLAPAYRSARAAVGLAAQNGTRCEILLMLDRADDETLAAARRLVARDDRMIMVDLGDPAQARNLGVANARGRAVALLDGDDLFGGTWLARAHGTLRERGFGNVCLHPEYTVIFGEERAARRHIGMDHPDFRVSHSMFENYFTALSMAPIEVYRSSPFRPAAPERGFGHEDWAWIHDTIHRGVEHLVVPETLHAVRRRRSSRLAESRLRDHLPLPTPLFSGREIRLG